MSLGNDCVLAFKRSEIVSENVDVIVNAANEQLEHTGGVAGALNNARQRRITETFQSVYKPKKSCFSWRS